MVALTIRNIDPDVKERLRRRAAGRGHSMEAELRRIVLAALSEEEPAESGRALGERIRARFAPLGGVELDIPPRGPGRPLPDFE